MADQPQNIVLVMLRDIRAKQDGHPAYLQRMEACSGDVEKHLYDIVRGRPGRGRP
jgi:hypothetical protein